MHDASLHIESIPDGLAFTWRGPGGDCLNTTRSVHEDDLRYAAEITGSPPSAIQGLEEAGTRLFSRLLERRVREAVFNAPYSHLLLTTDLPHIPWELAFRDGRFLFDLHAVGRGPEVTAPTLGTSLRVLMVVNPTDDLPFSATEAAQVAERLRNVRRIRLTTLTGAAATRHGVLSALETQPFDAVHFSCHAVLDPDRRERSHLRMFDGPLTAEDLGQAHMAVPPSLCVLNACASGRDGPDGAAGIAAALRASGAPAVIGTLWPVNNKSAGFLTASLYAGLCGGETVGESLRAARAETRRAFAYDPLQSWAAFLLSGSPALRLVEPGPPVRLGRAAMVGRDDEMARLSAAWADARAGRATAVLVLGGSGSGKTRLLEEWTSTVPASHVLNLMPPGDGGARVALEAAGLPFHEGNPSRQAVAVAEWASARGGAIVLCDGCDSSARETVEMLEAILRLGADAPLLLLLAARDPEPLAALPAARMRILRLAPLNAECVRAIHEALDAPPPETDVAMWPGEAERMALDLPDQQAPGMLANALPEAVRDALRAAAVLGERFTLEDLAALRRIPLANLWRPLERLIREGWLVEETPSDFRFRRPGDREAVLEAIIPSGERLELHRRVAELMEGRGLPGEQGCHWLAAGLVGEAHDAFFTAFLQASNDKDCPAMLRWHEALTGTGEAPTDCFYQEDLGDALAAAARWEEAIEAWEMALLDPEVPDPMGLLWKVTDACLKVGDEPLAEANLLAAVGYGVEDAPMTNLLRSELMLRRCRPEEARNLAARVLETPRLRLDEGLFARAALAAAEAALLMADAAAAELYCEVGLAEPDATSAVATGLKRAQARARQYTGDYEGAETILRALAGRQQAAHEPHERASTLLALAELCRDQGRLDPALDLLGEARTLGERCRQPDLLSAAANLEASVKRRQGRYAAALETARTSASIASSARLRPAELQAAIQEATVLAETGELAPALQTALQAAESARLDGYTFAEAWARTIAGVACLEANDPAAAATAFRKAEELSESIHGHIGLASARYYLAWAQWDAGRLDPGLFAEAEETAARISYCAVQHPAAFGRILAEGRPAETEEALHAVEALNMGPVAAWLRARRGAWRIDRDPDAAMTDLASAYRVARRLGMRALQARAADGLAFLYEAAGDPQADAMRAEAAGLRRACLNGWPETVSF